MPNGTAGKSLLSRPIAKTRPLQQGRIDLAAMQARAAASGGGGSSSSLTQRAAPLRQASLHQLAGVVDYREGPPEASVGVATTLYLGEEDLAKLKDRINAAVEAGDDETVLTVLKRLSAMPVTRACLESTRIGVSVGHLRRHTTAEVRDLAGRIVDVWKRQLKEHKAQERATKHGPPPRRC